MGSDHGSSAIPEAQFRLLTDLSTDERPHSGRSLFDHLAGTRALLLEWGNDDDIAAAGLFHSMSPAAAAALGALVEDGARPQQRSPGSSSAQS